VYGQTVISLTPDTTDVPIPSNRTVTWTAAVAGGTGPLTYQFWRFDATSGWSLVQDYGFSNSYTWTPSLADAGEHALQVWVRNAGSSSTYDAWAGTGFFTVGPTVTLTPSEPGPIGAGSSVTYTASATGLRNPVFQFWRFDDESGWHLVQPYGSTSTYSWQSSPDDRGQHAVQVWASESMSHERYDAWTGTALFSLVDPQPIVPSAPSSLSNLPAPAGLPLTFVAPAAGGIQPLEYQFWRFDSDIGWTKVQEYGSSSTYTWWTPGVRDVGSHALQVWVRSLGSTAPYEAWSGTGWFDIECPAFTLTANDNFYRSDRPPSLLCTPPSCALSGVALTGTPLTISADVCGGTGAPLEFQFWRTKVGVTDWEIVQDFGGPQTFDWVPSASEAGVYIMQARARRVGFGFITAFEGIDTKQFSVSTPGADLVVSITSPPVAAHAGASVVVTDTVTNIGPASSASCTNRYILDNVLIGSRVVPPLAPTATNAGATTLALPSRPGAFYLTVENNCSPDLNIFNNQRSIAVRILP
jgi:hypothetical protein